MHECLDFAASSPEEVCGLIIDDQRYFPCKNTHSTPSTNFRISDEDWLTAESEGEITAIFHSHPSGHHYLSAADRIMQLQTGLAWWLACDAELYKYRPVPHLNGRRFEHGVMDCYTLMRDAYHLCGVELPDFERTTGWWLRGENLYLKNLEANGFRQIQMQDAQPGDVIIRKPFPGADPCHSMILLADNMVIHHDCAGHISRREPYRLAYVKQTHSIWRSEQCSSLNLAAISADISAR